MAIVAPVTKTPVNSGGSSNRSRSHSPAIRSTFAASARGVPSVGLLVECGGEPIGAERGRRRPADDEVEEARPARPRGRRRGPLGQLGEGRRGTGTVLGKQLVELVEAPVCGSVVDELVADRADVRGSLPGGEFQRGFELIAGRERIGHQPG